MDDFTLFERTAEIKDSICILCNDNDQMVQDWVVRLTDTDFPFSEVKSVDQLRELPGPDRPEFIVLPHEHSGWEDAAKERKKKHDRSLVVSIGGFAFFLAVERMNPGMPEKFSEKWNKEADELLLDGWINALLLTDPCVLRDKDCDSIKKEHPVLVCSPTKVGSKTIEYSLKAIGVPNRHLHAIRGEKIINTILELDEPVKIITGVRDPVARELSQLFMMLSLDTKYRRYPGGLDEIIKKMKSINWYTGRVVFEYQPNPYGQSFGWFDTELKDHFGLDIFAEPFDREKGFGIYKKNNIEVFVYKLEKLNSLEGELQKFLDRDDFKLVSANIAAEKDIADVYRGVQDNLKESDAYLDFCYKDNDRIRYFYTDEEIDAFDKKWRKL